MDEEIVNKPKFQLSEFFKKNKSKIIIFAILIFISILTAIIFNEYRHKKNVNISIQYNKAKILIENKKTDQALEILEDIINKKNNFYSPSSLNLLVDNNLVKDKKKVLSYFDQIISNKKLDNETKNLFIFKKIVFIGDDIKENELLSNLNPIIKSDSLWKSTISDYIKKYYLSKGEYNKAKEFEIFRN